MAGSLESLHPTPDRQAMAHHLDERKIGKVDGRVMRRANRAIVLNLVRGDPSLSRSSIARLTGLSPGTVGAIVDRLVQEGFVREEGAAVTGAVGRRPQRLAFVPSARVAVGIAIDILEVRAALVDLGGEVRSEQRAAVPEGATAAAVLDIATQLAQRALRHAPAQHVLGIGMAVPGIVSWPRGVNLFSPNFGWRNLPVREPMEQSLKHAVFVDNEVRAVALAEHQFGVARGARNAVILDAGYGLGGAVIIDGMLYRGAHGGAGEMGHNTAVPDGPLCSCGNHGCFEVFGSSHGLISRAKEALAAGRPSSLAGLRRNDLTVGDIVEVARSGDELARELIDSAARYLGIAVANAIDNWDPELVVLSGQIIQEGGSLFDDLLVTQHRSVLESARTRVRIARASLGANAKVVGAAYMVVADYLSAPLPHRGSLVI
ncbi:MAG: ROK family transcriptional regulator [Chloroflexi bacterium]|nr:ROK family transcriptional regulator [Chloroflexota bacterium]